MKKIALYEPWFFLLFGVFHLHRIWGLIDRKSYADFRIDTTSPYWNTIWLMFILLGGFVFGLGIKLLIEYQSL